MVFGCDWLVDVVGLLLEHRSAASIGLAEDVTGVLEVAAAVSLAELIGVLASVACGFRWRSQTRRYPSVTSSSF
jgi:hypothetical protein